MHELKSPSRTPVRAEPSLGTQTKPEMRGVGAAKSPAYLTIYQQSKCGIARQHQLERYQGTHWRAGILNKVLSTMPRSASTEKQH